MKFKKFLVAVACAGILSAGSVDASAIVDMQKNSSSDYEKITQLINWERQSRVRHLYDELADCYFEDATVTISWTRGSIADFLKGGNRAEAAGEQAVVGRISPAIVHRHKSRAYVELPATTLHWVTVNGEEAVLTTYMRLIYRVERRNGIWRIVDLTSINEDDTLEPAVAGTDLHIDAAELKNFRHSYRFLAYVRTKAGGTVSGDLLGIDRPADVEKIYRDAEDWIRAAR